jgi:hypothetical protein
MSDKEKESKKRKEKKVQHQSFCSSAYPQTRQFFEWRDMSSRSQQPGF